jgi:hypothetical protein
MTREKNLVGLVQGAVDEGATTVEEIHKAIADLPLRILEENKLLPEATKEVRRVQDHTIGVIYDLIREINEKVGKLASDVLEEARQRRTPHRAEHKKRSTAAAAH